MQCGHLDYMHMSVVPVSFCGSRVAKGGSCVAALLCTNARYVCFGADKHLRVAFANMKQALECVC